MIISEYLNSRALPAPLAISPCVTFYDESWEPEITGGERVELSSLLLEAGLGDFDNDTWLDYETASGYVPLELTMIVSLENQTRVNAARSIVDTLRHVGLNITLSELTTSAFNATLNSGAFDLYYGETRMPADFDISELVLPGGSLNFGSLNTGNFTEVIDTYLSASDNTSRTDAARDMCMQVLAETPFIPIAYLQYAVYSARGQISVMPISVSGIFCRINEWTM